MSNTLALFIYNKCDISSSLAEVVFKRNGYKLWVCIVMVSISKNDVISDSAEEWYF